VQREFAALAEGLLTSVDAAHEGLLVRVRVLVFAEVLRQREHFAAVLAREGLAATVDVVVTFQREFGREALVTGWEIALVDAFNA